MYEEFFRLKENPFRMTPDPKFLYLGQDHREALAQLLYGIEEGKGFMVITGEVGTGKTTLIHCVLQKLNAMNHNRTALLFNPRLTVREFFEYILMDLGVDVNGGNKADSLHALHKTLLDAYRKGERVILFVDEAKALPPVLLEEIRLLSNLETSKSKLLQIILIGQPELNNILLQPEFRQLRQRINLRCHLKPLSKEETKKYIEKRLKIAGAKEEIFTEKAIEEIYQDSQGVPRLINILCDHSLLNAYASDQIVVDRKLVREAAKDMKLGPDWRRLWGLSIILIFISGSILSYLFMEKGELLLSFSTKLLEHLQSIKNLIFSGFNILPL